MPFGQFLDDKANLLLKTGYIFYIWYFYEQEWV